MLKQATVLCTAVPASNEADCCSFRVVIIKGYRSVFSQTFVKLAIFHMMALWVKRRRRLAKVVCVRKLVHKARAGVHAGQGSTSTMCTTTSKPRG